MSKSRNYFASELNDHESHGSKQNRKAMRLENVYREIKVHASLLGMLFY
jgi:hypothetical protein